MIHLYSGEGKGKTSIVTGMAVRMAGAGKRVIFAQFMKGNESSEIKALRQIPGITILRVNKNFGFYKDMTEEDKRSITEFHNGILKKIVEEIQNQEKEQGKKKQTKEKPQKTEVREKEEEKPQRRETQVAPELLVILDEVTYPCRWNLLDEGLLKKMLSQLPETVELAMTGRNPKGYMIEMCDYWSEVGMRRHPFERNITARKGIEF